MRNGSKGIEIPVRFLYGHLPEIPSHDFLQKVRGYIDGFVKLREGQQSAKKYYFLPSRSRRILPLETPTVFRPKLMTCVRNGAFLGETPKTTLQEELVTSAEEIRPLPYSYSALPSGGFDWNKQPDGGDIRATLLPRIFASLALKRINGCMKKGKCNY
jgi:hypothetical protein